MNFQQKQKIDQNDIPLPFKIKQFTERSNSPMFLATVRSDDLSKSESQTNMHHSFHKKDELSQTLDETFKISKLKEIGNRYSNQNVKLKDNIFHNKFPGPEALRDLIKYKINRSALRNQNLTINDENINYLPNR